MTTTASSIPATTINHETRETRFDLVLDLIANVTLAIQEKIDKTDWSDPDLADPIDTDCDPSIEVTFAIDRDFNHTLVSGDNSLSGPHESFPHWGVSWITKLSRSLKNSSSTGPPRSSVETIHCTTH